MTQPDRAVPDPLSAVRDMVQTELLHHLDGDVLPMAHLDTLIADALPEEAPPRRQTMALDLIAALLADRRILVGDVIGGDPAFIEPWSGSDSDILDRIRSMYVQHYDATELWVFRIWLSLNDERRIHRPDHTGHPV